MEHTSFSSVTAGVVDKAVQPSGSCSCSLTYLAFIHLSNFIPGPLNVSCCSSFTQSLLTEQVSADLGRSPDCLLFHWDRGRPHQTQFGIITELLEEMCDHTTLTDTYTHSNAHTHTRSACWVLCSAPNHPTSPLYTHTCTSPLPPPRGTHKYMLSLRQKELQGALKLALAALAALQACTPHPALRPSPSSLTNSTCILYSSSCSLSVCHSSVLHRLPAHCGSVAMQHPLSLRPQSHLWSLFLSFSSYKVHFVIDLSNTSAATLHLLFSWIKQQNNIQYILVFKCLTLSYLRPSKFGLDISVDCSVSVTSVK